MEELKNPFLNYQFQFETTIYKNEREEIVAEFVKEINYHRVGTKYKPVTPKQIALRLNGNKILAKSDSECRLLLKKCIDKNSFSFFFYCCPLR